MNANELANKLENKDRLWNVDETLMIKTCAMLRQLQAENEALKSKTLTDKEILNCWFEAGQMLTIQQARIQFARAILKKAQEK